jgi:hypothetical protein
LSTSRRIWILHERIEQAVSRKIRLPCSHCSCEEMAGWLQLYFRDETVKEFLSFQH